MRNESVRYGLSQYAAPATEPVSTAEAKTHLRVTYTEDDALIAALITAARQWVEEQTYRALVSQTWDLTLDEFPTGDDPIRIPRAPLVSVTSITYTDTAGASQTLAAANYVVSATRQPGLIRPAYNCEWPEAQDKPDAVTVRFVAGYGAAAAVPETLKAAIKLLVGQLYEHREAAAPVAIHEVPLGVQRILQLYDLGDELLEYGQVDLA